MKPKRHPATRQPPATDLPAIEQQMLKVLRAGQQPATARAAMAITLLKSATAEAEAVQVLQSLAANPRTEPALFSKISRALVSHEATVPEKIKRARPATKSPDLYGPANFTILLNDALNAEWLRLHPDSFFQPYARLAGCSPAVMADWPLHGHSIINLLAAAGVRIDNPPKWWAKNSERVRNELAEKVATLNYRYSPAAPWNKYE